MTAFLDLNKHVNALKLKVKSNSLAAEAKIIKKEERKLNSLVTNHYPELTGQLATYQLGLHRTRNVRFEARATHLARAFINGKPYITVEAKRKPEKEVDFYQYVMPRVFAMVKKYGELFSVERNDGESYSNWSERCNKALSDSIDKWAKL